MERSPLIVVRRIPTASPEGFHFTFSASLRNYSGTVDLWCASAIVAGLGQALRDFPSSAPEKYEFYFEEPEYTQNLTLRAKASVLGHCALELRLAAEHAECIIEFAVEAAAINRLGASFLRVLKSDGGGFRWTATTTEDLEDGLSDAV